MNHQEKMDLFISANILNFVHISKLLDYSRVCQDWYQLCKTIFDSRNSIQDVWFKTHLKLRTKYNRFQKKGSLLKQFHHVPLGITFTIFNYCDPSNKKQVFLFVVKDQFDNCFLIHSFQQKKSGFYSKFQFYPFSNKLMISGFNSMIFEFCLTSFNFVSHGLSHKKTISRMYNETKFDDTEADIQSIKFCSTLFHEISMNVPQQLDQRSKQRQRTTLRQCRN